MAIQNAVATETLGALGGQGLAGMLNDIITAIEGAGGGHTHLLAVGATDVTADKDEINKLDGLATTKTELGYVAGVTSAIQTQINNKPNVCDIQVFTTIGSNTWTKPTGAKIVDIFLISGGGGGGSGRKGADGSGRAGGGGGGSGNISFCKLPASTIGDTETVTIGDGGTGGASITNNSTNGNDGTVGENTSFGSWLIAKGGGKGEGGSTTDNDNVSSGYSYSFINQVGIMVSFGGSSYLSSGGSDGYPSAGNISSYENYYFINIGSGGGGGSIDTDNTDYGAGDGGVGSYERDLVGLSGGGNGENGVSTTAGLPFGGSGGGGGDSSTSGNATDGGDGGIYGAGGGGGGAAVNSVGNSGAGGNGAQGIAIITTYF